MEWNGMEWNVVCVVYELLNLLYLYYVCYV